MHDEVRRDAGLRRRMLPKIVEIGASILTRYIERYGTERGLSAYNSGSPDAAPRYTDKVLRLASAAAGIDEPQGRP